MKPLVCFAIFALATTAVAQQPPEPKPTRGISVIHFVAPVYPETAQTVEIAGDVHVRAQLGSDGRVKKATALTGNRELQRAATRAIRQWRFRCNACELPRTYDVTVRFLVDPALDPTCVGKDLFGSTRVEPSLPDLVTVRAGRVCVITGPGITNLPDHRH